MRYKNGLFSYIVCALLVFSLAYGYVLDHHRPRGDSLRAREEGLTSPQTPVKTNEEEDEERGNPWNQGSQEENGFLTENGAENESTNGERYWSSMFDRYLPPSYHGHFQLGPGLTFNVSTGVDFNGVGAWWQGPNVCVSVDKKEGEDGDVTDRRSRRIFHHRLMITHSCDDTESVRKCTTVQVANGRTTRITKTYECCPGFSREEDQPHCVEEVEKVDLISTMEQLSVTEMVRALAITGLTNVIQSANYTVFAPTNQAFDKYHRPETNSTVVVIDEEVERLANGLKTAMTSHIVSGAIKTSALEDEQEIQTENPDAKIRINRYSVMGRQGQLMTANCVRITKTNVKATNGVVHVVDSVLHPVSLDIKSIVRNNPKLSLMSSALERIDLDENGHYTLLAPTDQAFQKLSPKIREKILNGHTCGKDVIKQHILPNVICTAVIDGRVRTRNILNNYLHMSREPAGGDLFIERANVTQRDVMATNGVIHVIDDVILPSAAIDAVEAIEKAGATKFLELLRAMNLDRELDRKENYTLFVPSNQALEEASRLKLGGSLNEDDVINILSRHTVSGLVRSRQLVHGRKLNITNPRDVLTVQSYHTFFSRTMLKSVQCSPIIHADIDTCDAVVHVVNKVIVPSTGTVLDLLQKNSSFSDLFNLIRSVGLTEMFSNTQNSFTLFAPTNQAFRNLPSGFLTELRNDQIKARRILLSLMLPESRCCYAVTSQFMSRELNMDMWMISVERRGQRVIYGSVPVTVCDLSATNGLVHALEAFPEAVLRRYGQRAERRGSSEGAHGLNRSLNDLLDMLGLN